MRSLFFFSLFWLSLNDSVKATKVFQNLFINRGTLTTIKNTTFPFLAFNATSTFTAENVVVSCLKNDTLIITVTNNDTTLHGFKIKNYSGISYTINPAANITCTLFPTQRSIYTFYDHLAYPRNMYMGLAGMIAVKDKANDKVYYWNLKEHFTVFNQQLGYGLNWNNYYPDYFTINGKSYSQLQLDPKVKINNQVNDTIYIYVANTGQSMHSLHFHGFHPKAVYSDSKLIKQNWIKDTWGMFSMDCVVLRMIPDKTGKYSVHDHNLVAVTGGNTHPNGMFTIMQINP
ncbi:MAG: multicopper oxidase domain-containing protein [Bacteroidetes bacterium]|nr:multicopper oxidase domain-containing protein [Bacteroidota bacterium]